MTAIEDLRARLAEIGDLSRTAALLAWDERTMMPVAGGEARSNQHATLAKVRHEMFCDDEIGRLLESGAGYVDGAERGESSEDSINAVLVRLVSRDWEKARRVPSELRAEMARAGSIGEQAWVEARNASDFSMLLPHLEKNVELARRYADCYEGFEDFSHPYDPLLDEYEPEMSTAQMREVLGELREGLVPIVREADPDDAGAEDGAREGVQGDVFHGEFDESEQRALLADLVAAMPFPEGYWRLDPTEHPFATSVGHGDVRLTTRYEQSNLGMALFSTLHEAGHGLYEAGVDAELARTPLAKPRSLGLHESQSRLWENWVGRGRPYLGHILPKLRERFPESFGGEMDVDSLFRDANRIERSLVRIEADEVTYNLHILIRFELELEIFEDSLALEDLPEAWNARYRDYLGVEVADDGGGVLQDVHWPGGAFGYFPTYTLGNVIAAQLWEAASHDIDGLDTKIGSGELAPLGDWLREKAHRHGRRLSPGEVLEGAGCGPVSVAPLLRHLEGRVQAAGAPA